MPWAVADRRADRSDPGNENSLRSRTAATASGPPPASSTGPMTVATSANLRLPTRCRHDQLHQLLGDLRLVSLRVALVDAHDVGDDATVLGIGIDVHLSRAGSRFPSPTQRGVAVPPAVMDLAGLGVDNI